MVDVAHATGILGPRRSGLAGDLAASDRIEIHLGTLGKALGSRRRVRLCGSGALIDYLINRAPHMHFLHCARTADGLGPSARAALSWSNPEEGRLRCAAHFGRSWTRCETAASKRRVGRARRPQCHYSAARGSGGWSGIHGRGIARARRPSSGHPLSHRSPRSGASAPDALRRAHPRRSFQAAHGFRATRRCPQPATHHA